MIVVPLDRSWDDWRLKARELLAQKVAPHLIHWQCETHEFVMGESFVDRQTFSDIRLPREFIETASVVSAYRDDTTWDLLYRVAWRLQHENRQLLRISIDPDVREFEARRNSVGRDLHKMHAFVRFREVKTGDESVFMAWHRPDHRITRLASPFFKDRFNGMKWVIMTEDESMSWDKKTLTFMPGVPQHELPPDEKEDLWKTYYSSIFNPARVKVSMMKKEMAVRYWNTLPEAELITSLLDQAPTRVEEFYEAHQPIPVIAPAATLEVLNAALSKCQSCGICAKANGPVMGEGSLQSRMAFIGEQPGNEEDLQRRPFLGPAGKVLMQAFKDVGINRDEVYLTNAVKGFKWVEGYMDRQHRTANAREISTCRPWLQGELGLVKPEILVCLGRTAAQSVLGKLVKLDDVRGQFFETPFSPRTIVLPHPASILRTQDPREQQLAKEKFLQEMRMVKNAYDGLQSA